MPVLLLILLLPLIEISLFILVGGRIGVAPVLVLILLSLFLGILVLRANQSRARALMQDGLRQVSPGTFLAQGAFGAIGGLLLLLPGFLTDALGVVLLLPPVQRLIMRAIASRIDVQRVHLRQGHDIVEGDFRVHPEPDDQPPPSDRRLSPPKTVSDDDENARH